MGRTARARSRGGAGQGAVRPPVALLVLAAVWGAALLLAPPESDWGWALSGFRSVPLPARLGLIAAVAAVTALATRRLRGGWVWLAAAAVLALLVAFPLRERVHLLADTDLRLRSIGGFAAGEPGVALLEWSRRLHSAPLDLAVDFLLPVGLVRAGLDVADAVSCVSVLLALAFLAGLARLVVRLDVAPEGRHAVFVAMVLAGTLEAFAGYAEVAGLVLATLAWWWVVLLGPLDSRGRASRVALSWLALLLAHRIGLVLLPAQLWRALGPALPGDRPGARRWLLVFTALAAGAAYALSAIGGGGTQVAIDADQLLRAGAAPTGPRVLDFANSLLLVAPLALAAPLAAGRRALGAFARDRRTWLVAVAALPLLPVHWLELSAANGLGAYREWDLGAALGVTATAGAALLLAFLPGPRLRAALLACMPVLALQAGSWLAVQADESAGVQRALALAGRLLPAQRGTLYLYLGQRAMDAQDPVLAARYYEQAFELVPDPETGVLAAETCLLARDVEGARRMVAQARVTGSPSATSLEILQGLDSLIASRDASSRAVAPAPR